MNFRNRSKFFGSDSDALGGLLFITGIFCLIFAVWSCIAVLDPAVSNIYSWALLGTLPFLFTFMMYANNMAVGLPTKSHQVLAQTYIGLPRKLVKEMPLTRTDILNLTEREAETLNTKILNARSAYNEMYNSNVSNANSFMDSIIATHKEMH